MEVEYRREMNRNYMVIRPETVGSEKYTLRMLSGNRIQGLLPFQDKMVNGEMKYYYDITSKQPLDRILEHRNISGPELRTLMTELLFALKQMERYLLDEGQLIFQPNYIYVDPGTFKTTFCLVPGMHQEFTNAFCELSQYLLDHVNQSDGDAVVLAFSIFRECRKLNFGMDDIEQCLRKSEKLDKNGSFEPVEGKEPISKVQDNVGNHGYRENSKEHLPDEYVKTSADKKENETKPVSKTREIRKPWKSQMLLPGIAAMLGMIMVILPITFYIWKGIRGLYRWKWILLIAEIILAVSIGVVLYLCQTDGEEPPSADQRKRFHAKHNEDHKDDFFGWSSFPETKNKENPYEEEEAWVFQLRDPEEEEEALYPREPRSFKTEIDKYGRNASDEDEIQTVLLSSRPIYKECRKLVSVSDGSEIAVGYFPFLIGKNRDLTDHCLNKPGVSRLHVKLEETETGYTVTDLNSTNGTSVNGRLLEANETAVLNPGDELMIAGERFYFR